MFTSALENVGLEDFKTILENHEGIVAFSGFSGVGKSTLLSAITNKELETGDVSTKLKRGKHTTRHVELFEFNKNSYFADTPGFSMLELPKFAESELELYFPEFNKFLGECKFNGCSHINERDCRIKDAVSNGFISESRYKSYKCFYEKLKSMKEWK
jgi:ribosome biogenesis GTPase